MSDEIQIMARWIVSPTTIRLPLRESPSKGKEAMAELWEVSVVLALRDQQWLMRDASIPMPSVNLSGNAESRLGDCLLTAKDRFFLIEVKPTAEKFKSEWAVDKTAGEERFKKRAFASVIKLAEELGRRPTPTSKGVEPVLRSLLGHHFVFWDEEEGALAIQPYLSTSLSGYSDAMNIAAPLFIKRGHQRSKELFSLSLSDHSSLADSNIFTICNSGFFSEIYSQRLGIAIKAKHPNGGAWLTLGLLPEDFKEYLQTLCTPMEEINAIILSDQGFIHALRDTQDIAEFLTVLSGRIEALKTVQPSVRQVDQPMLIQQAATGATQTSAPYLELSDYLAKCPSAPGSEGP